MLRSAEEGAKRLQALESARSLIDVYQKVDPALLDAVADAFFAPSARDSSARARFVELFRAYAALSSDAARDLGDALFTRLGGLSVALDLDPYRSPLDGVIGEARVREIVGNYDGRARDDIASLDLDHAIAVQILVQLLGICPVAARYGGFSRGTGAGTSRERAGEHDDRRKGQSLHGAPPSDAGKVMPATGGSAQSNPAGSTVMIRDRLEPPSFS